MDAARSLARRVAPAVAAAILLGSVVAADPTASSGPAAAGATASCPAPSTSTLITLSYRSPTPAVVVHPGESFAVVVPAWSWGPISTVAIANRSVLRRECTELRADGSRYEVLFAAAPGRSMLSATVAPRGNLFVPDWLGAVAVATPPVSLTPLPARVTGHVTRRGGYADPVASGAVLTRAQLASLTAGDIIGRDGFALAILDGFEYPLVTHDGGATWRVAGLWFAGPWADGAAFASRMVTFSGRVAVAYDPSGVVYATRDAGAHWYGAYFPSTVMRVTAAPSAASVPPAALVVTIVRAGPHGAVLSRYRSLDGGRVWTLARAR
ncbi:MAG: hypothetical protein KGJ36_03680 [Acidobacteriota bacterium]|nr:hypothetical protein [Acidobacteriota bacterium]